MGLTTKQCWLRAARLTIALVLGSATAPRSARGAVAATQSAAALTVPGLQERWSLHGQTTVVSQGHPALHSPYAGANSLSERGEIKTSWTATVFGGVGLWPGASLFFNPEIAMGSGLSSTHGIAGFPNGEIYRVDSTSFRFNVSRLFLQQVVGWGPASTAIGAGPNRLAQQAPETRLTWVLGKFSLNDYFDTNVYSHDPRSQFLNWGLMDTGAWDYAADTRGYTWGFYWELAAARWAVRVASVLEPATANGLAFDWHVRRAHGSNAEVEYAYAVGSTPGRARLLAYANQAHMGWYADAVAQGGIPDIVATRRYRTKLGAAFNLEQSLGGRHGVFLRAGIADGRSETWAFTEIDRSLSVGGQLDGALWGRENDTVGVALLFNGLAADHAAFLHAGGIGFIIGDGGIDYVTEKIAEIYYQYKPWSWLAATLDIQGVAAPAYNADRGPTIVGALRLHAEI